MIARIINLDESLYVYPSEMGRFNQTEYLLPYNPRGYDLEHGDILFGDIMLSRKQYQRDRFRIDEVYYIKDVDSFIDILESIVIGVVNSTHFFNEPLPFVNVEKLQDRSRKRECVMVRSIMAYIGHVMISAKSKYFTDMMQRYGLLRSTAYNGIKKVFNYLDIDDNMKEAVEVVKDEIIPFLGKKKCVDMEHRWYSYLYPQQEII